MMEGVNSTKTYYKHLCKCHNVPSVQQRYDNKTFREGKKQNIDIMCQKDVNEFWDIVKK
jgi:hypothetical protein